MTRNCPKMNPQTFFFSLLFGISLLGGVFSRIVSVPPGPLIRVEGQPISIRCDVNDYGGPDEQDFEWVMKRTQNGPQIKIISTFDTSYSHPSLTRRVASGEISMNRLKDNEVELKISDVKQTDSGFYNCQTPSTDSEIKGNYEAQVELIVIPNTLKVSPAAPVPVVSESGDIVLSCNVTRELSQPTYLSVTWSIRKSKTLETEEILSFGPQGEVTTGPKYTRRYSDGGVRLVPGQHGVFELVIAKVTTSDDGTYGCTGTEWAHESSGQWLQIVESTKEMGPVTVTPISQSLTITASSLSPVILTPGASLSLLCSVTVDNLPQIGLEVTWLSNGRDLITMEMNGVVVSNGTNYRADASLERVAPGQVRLSVRGVTTEDAGAYSCRVRAFVEKGGRSSGGGGRWHMAAEKMSSTVNVKVAQIKPSFTLTLEPIATPKVTSEPMELACHVTNITNLPAGGRLGVSWQYSSGSNPQTSNLIGSLDAGGNLLPGTTYSDRLDTGAITLGRVQPNTFKLRFLRAQEVDMGQYSCVVSAWTVNSQGGFVKATEQPSPALPIKWDPKRPSLNVVARTIREASVGGSTFEMSCAMTTENLGEAGYSVLIQSQESVGASIKTIMTFSPDSVVQHGGATDPKRRDQLVLLKSGAAEFRFRLGGVQLSDRGFYWCDITAWTKQSPGQTWTKATSAESNKVKIQYQENGPSFAVALRSDSTTVYPWETAKMECVLSISGSSPKSDDIAYEVRWFFTELRGGDTAAQLISMDCSGVVRKEARNSSSDVSVQRTDTHSYELSVHGAQDSDSGEYHCVVTPCYVSPSTKTWTKAEEITSSRIFLTVKFAVWDSLKLPLLYGTVASIGVGLFSLIFGLVCAHCCCRNTSHTPLSRNKLLHLEMD
ncbi:prostaglandin F2 receptor negative regulator [Periophthalmus magnuspinnatus]|uniref:prostaglandin F2 receptor negative regulator n=1 Tax=Periophthalmus magnuspinnatus TaxID=409849 RepID=UPI00145A26F4|nr:prostaglandin F2 receptor negative regulator [Periophthalmus magnuspinnatus]